MSDTPDSLSPEDDQLFEVLDRYVNLLHQGDLPNRSQLLINHPHLANYMSYLESLEEVAAQILPDRVSDPQPTLNLGGSDSQKIVPQTSPASEQSEKIFGRYELLEEIGRGGMGVVFRAQQTDLNREVAIKMILSSQFASDDEIRRFYLEARAAGSLRHPNIVSIHEISEVKGQHYFAMDLVSGPNLAELLSRESTIEPDQAATWLAQIARAVDYLHCHNIIHRDLKPSNILLDDEGNPQVTDFGLAKFFQEGSEKTRTGTIVGTPSYMAPEQAAGRTSEVTPRSDVYSLGAVLYEMLTGRPPFLEENPLDTLVQVLESESELPTRVNKLIPRELELICMRCLEKDARNRYASAAELAEDLQRYLKREPVEARPSGIRQKLRRWGRREPALVSRLAVLGIAAIIVQGSYWLSTNPAWDYHVRVMSILGGWTLAAFTFQQLMNREQYTEFAKFGWAATDACLLTLMLTIVDGPVGPLLIVYPLLVTACGMFFRVRLVLFMTIIAMIAFAALVWLRNDPAEFGPDHYPVIFEAVLFVLGLVVAYQVYRVRVLSKYYEHRRM